MAKRKELTSPCDNCGQAQSEHLLVQFYPKPRAVSDEAKFVSLCPTASYMPRDDDDDVREQ